VLKDAIGSHDLLFVTLDTLRYDVAAALAAAGRTPNLCRVLPGGVWEERHTPATFTYAAHLAFFAGFLPTPVTPGPHPRLYAARFPGSATTTEDTWVFEAADLPTAMAEAGYHTACIGGVGFFNPRSPLGRVLPSLFAESHWSRRLGVTDPDSLRHQLDVMESIVEGVPADRPLFTFLNVSALHQPTCHYLPGATRDTVDSHAAALEYVDGWAGRLWALAVRRGRPCFTIVCSDHGTAYGEDGHEGHRWAHPVVWTVPYAHFTLHPGQS